MKNFMVVLGLFGAVALASAAVFNEDRPPKIENLPAFNPKDGPPVVENLPMDGPQQLPIYPVPTLYSEDVPVQNLPADEVPVQNLPVQNLPADNAPVQNLPVEDVPVQNLPADNAPVQNLPVEDVPVQNLPNDQFVKVIGQRVEGDEQAYSAFIFRQPAANRVVEMTKNFTVDFFGLSRRAITQIVVTNRLNDDTTSSTTLTAGGPGTGYATFVFKNEQGKPIAYKIDIFAKYN